MNGPFFLLRTLIYFSLWIFVSWRLWSGSLHLGETRDARVTRRLHSLSALRTVLYFATMSLATVDWLMSREPHWYSTILGFQVICGQAVTATSFVIIMLGFFSEDLPFRGFVRT